MPITLPELLLPYSFPLLPGLLLQSATANWYRTYNGNEEVHVYYCFRREPNPDNDDVGKAYILAQVVPDPDEKAGGYYLAWDMTDHRGPQRMWHWSVPLGEAKQLAVDWWTVLS